MLFRTFSLRDAEVAADGRTLVLACVPFDQPATVDDGDGPYREVFRRGAFASVAGAANRVELRYAHDQDGMPYGFGVDLIEDPTHLIGTFRVAPSVQGDQMIALVADGQLGSVSIGYVAGQSRDIADSGGALVERVKVKRLKEVSMAPTGTGAFKSAQVLAIRQVDPLVEARRRARALWDIEKLRYLR